MVTINNAKKILQRAGALPLYLHAYAFHLNMWLERVLPADSFDTANENNPCSAKTHVLDSKRFSLGNMDDKELSTFGDKARRLDLDAHIEASTSNRASIDEAAAIVLKAGASPIRFYSRYEGNLCDVLSIVTNDITYVQGTYQDSGLTFTIEQHEDLKSHELVLLVKENEVEPLPLPFDSASTINVSEHPINALKTVTPHIIQVYTEDALIIKEQDDLDRKACISGRGDVPFKALLTHFICLGDDEPQVTAYGLKEEVGYCALAFRFESEGDNPWILYCQMSKTLLPENHLLNVRLRREKEDTISQINHVRNVLQQVKQGANHLLNH